MARTALSTLLALLVVLAGAASITDNFAAWTSETLRRRAVAAHPLPLAAARLVDQDGQRFDLPAGIRQDGRYVLVDFVYTRCNSVCSALGDEFQQLQQQIAARGLGARARLLSISFDPAHDTPAALHAYAERMHADPALWQFATVSEPAALPALLRQFGIVVIPDGVGGYTHNAAIHVIRPDARLTHIVDIDQFERALSLAAAEATQ